MKAKRLFTTVFSVLFLVCTAVAFAACAGKKKTYTVSLDYKSEEGTVSLSPAKEDNVYEEDTEVTVSVTAKTGFEVDAFTVSTDEDAALTAGKYTFKVTADTTVKATFKSTAPAEGGEGDEGEDDVYAADYVGTWTYGVDLGVTITSKALTVKVADESYTASLVTANADGSYKIKYTADSAEQERTVKLTSDKKVLLLITEAETGDTAYCLVDENKLPVAGSVTYAAIAGDWEYPASAGDELPPVSIYENGKIFGGDTTGAGQLLSVNETAKTFTAYFGGVWYEGTYIAATDTEPEKITLKDYAGTGVTLTKAEEAGVPDQQDVAGNYLGVWSNETYTVTVKKGDEYDEEYNLLPNVTIQHGTVTEPAYTTNDDGMPGIYWNDVQYYLGSDDSGKTSLSLYNTEISFAEEFEREETLLPAAFRSKTYYEAAGGGKLAVDANGKATWTGKTAVLTSVVETPSYAEEGTYDYALYVLFDVEQSDGADGTQTVTMAFSATYINSAKVNMLEFYEETYSVDTPFTYAEQVASVPTDFIGSYKKGTETVTVTANSFAIGGKTYSVFAYDERELVVVENEVAVYKVESLDGFAILVKDADNAEDEGTTYIQDAPASVTIPTEYVGTWTVTEESMGGEPGALYDGEGSEEEGTTPTTSTLTIAADGKVTWDGHTMTIYAYEEEEIAEDFTIRTLVIMVDGEWVGAAFVDETADGFTFTFTVGEEMMYTCTKTVSAS